MQVPDWKNEEAEKAMKIVKEITHKIRAATGELFGNDVHKVCFFNNKLFLPFMMRDDTR